MKRLDKDDPRRWHRTVGKGGKMKREVAERNAAKAAPLPGAAPQPMPLEVGPGSFWPTPLGGGVGNYRLFVDHDAERLELTIVYRTMDAGTDVDALHTVPLCFAVLPWGPLLWIFMKRPSSGAAIALALGADTTEAATLRRLLLDPEVRKTAKVVFAVRDMVKLVRTIEDVSFPWRTLRHAAQLLADRPQPADSCIEECLGVIEGHYVWSLYEDDATFHSPPDFGRNPPKKRARRSPKVGESQRQPQTR